MKKTIKKFSLFLSILAIIILASTSVFAADNTTGFTDLTNTVTTNNANNTNTTNNANNANTNSANTNTNTPSTNTNVGNTISNTGTNKTNSSSYNNTNLPKTGIADTMPIILLVTVFGISAVYAYKKIKDYQNI